MEDCREESYLRRQEDELEALDSIFNDDFEDVRKKDKWKIPRPPEILLHLTPSESMSGNKDVHASATLRAKFDKNYPDIAPEIKLENTKGMSDEVLKDLTSELKRAAEQAVGEVMMLELSQIVQESLHKYNRPALSIYEENKKFKDEQRAKEKKKLEELKRRKQDYQRREIEEEINRRKEEEKNIKKDLSRKRNKSDEGGEHLDSTGSTGYDISQSPDVQVSEIEFNTKSQCFVYKGKCIDKESSGCMVFIAMDKDTGSPLSIHEWIIQCPGHRKYKTEAEQNKVQKYMKIVKAVEQELHSLLKLSHVNLINYLAMRYTEEEDHIHVDILQEFVTGTNLESRISGNESVSLSEVKMITEQLLNALDYLHCHSVVHKNLKASSVYLDTRGIVKLTDYSIEKRLADLYKESHIEQPGVTFIDDPIPAKNTKKGDILKLGMLLLSLVQGTHVKEYPPDIPTKLPSVFQDFLSKCLAVEDRVRMTASELLQHAFLKPGLLDSLDPVSELRNASDANVVSNESSSNDNDENRRDEPLIYPGPPQLLSRIHSEFEELQWLGKGGFGAVVQVKNKLDGRFYAIKRILLDPRRSQFNKKITREVKLLSRLNHENVVRYYNSWIETLLNPDETSTETSSVTNTTSKINDLHNVNSLGMIDDVELNAPPPAAHSYSDWASFDKYSLNQDSDDDDDEGEAELFKSFRYDTDEESVQFEGDGSDADEGIANIESVSAANLPTETTTDESSLGNVPKCYLYIQMEFCEKSTLREAINAGLYHNKNKMWRLFREILDGLVHIHEQGMIHRDLKPQNIFLDSDNHIKIGDFGLATSHTVGTADASVALDLARSKSEGGDSAMTGRIGTALYVAPELNKVASRTAYNQKVDIYSLGIIFFEMCYAGIETKMERVKVLGNMRLEEIKFPEDFDEMKMYNEAEIIRRCLNHLPEKRPSADELLRSPLVPAPAFEKSHVMKSVRQALQDSQSAPHRQLMQELFARLDDRKDDVFYDIDLYKGQFPVAQHLMQERVHSIVSSIMRRHGAVKVTPPLLVPRKQIQNDEENENSVQNGREYEGPPAATFMDTSGTIVTLPYDSRVPFARYVSRNGIYNLKRYAIQKVYRKVKIHRSHPREIWECAFDIVTPTVCNLIPEAEGICIISEIISAFSALSQQRSYEITVNHTVLLLAIFAHSGIPVNKYDAVKRVLAEAKMEKLSKIQLETKLGDLSLSSQQISTLCSFISLQGPLSKIQTLLKTLTRNKHSSVSSQARQGLHELDALRKNLESFGVGLPVNVHLGFVHNLHQYSGVIFQVSAEIRKKKRALNEVIAAGGRYDDLIQQLAIPQLNHSGALPNHEDSPSHSARKQCAFGVSIAIERIVALSLSEHQCMLVSSGNVENLSLPNLASHLLSNVDVLVGVIGRSQLFHERMRILKSLWDAGIRAEMTLEGSGTDADSWEVLQEIATQRSVAHLVILKDKDNSLKVRSFDPVHGFAKQQEKSLYANEITDYVLKKLKGSDDGSSISQRHSADHATSSSTTSTDTTQSSNVSAGSRRLNIEVLAPEKIAFNVKRRYETQASSKLIQLPILQHISGKAEVYALAVDLPAGTLKTMISGLEIAKEEDDFNNSVATVQSQVPKYKKYFGKIAEMIADAKFRKEVPLIILYSYKDDMYKVLS